MKYEELEKENMLISLNIQIRNLKILEFSQTL